MLKTLSGLQIMIFIYLGVFLVSCTKDQGKAVSQETEITNQQTLSSSQQTFETDSELPAILFSFNMFDTESNQLTKYFIDEIGTVKKIVEQTDTEKEKHVFLDAELDQIKFGANTLQDIKIDAEELLKRYSNLQDAKEIVFEPDPDHDSEYAKTYVAIYGYKFFDTVESIGFTRAEALCEWGDFVARAEVTSLLYSSVLLEQSIDSKSHQTAEGVTSLVNWLNTQLLEINAKDPSSN